MTIDEAIRFSEEVAEELNEKACDLYENEDYENTKDCIWGAKEHRQLAEWLRELKKYRAIFEKVGKILADNGYTMDDLDTIFGKINDEEVNADEDNN